MFFVRIWRFIRWEWLNRFWKNNKQKKLARCKAYQQIRFRGSGKWHGSREAYKSVLFEDGDRRKKKK